MDSHKHREKYNKLILNIMKYDKTLKKLRHYAKLIFGALYTLQVIEVHYVRKF